MLLGRKLVMLKEMRGTESFLFLMFVLCAMRIFMEFTLHYERTHTHTHTHLRSESH